MASFKNSAVSFSVVICMLSLVTSEPISELFVHAEDGRAQRNFVACDELQISHKLQSDAIWIPQCDNATNRLVRLQTTIEGLKFCVDPATGVNIFGPVNGGLSCNCIVNSFEARLTSAKPAYIPQCHRKTGAYLAKQCDRSKNCWCADRAGSQLGPRWTAVKDESQPRLSCALIRKYWEERVRKFLDAYGQK